MKKFGLLFTISGILLPGLIFASTTTPMLSGDEYRVGRGDIETSLSIEPRFVRGGGTDDESFRMILGGNYFLTDILSPGLEFELDVGSGTLFRLLPNLKAYYPLDSRVLPYLQAGFGYSHVFGEDVASLMIGPGVNYLLSSSVALGVQFRYDLGVGSETLHLIRLPIQFAIYFKY